MEIRKDIKGYEGLYQVSNTGLVKIIDNIYKNKFMKNGIIRKEKINNKGYSQIFIKHKGFLLHRLVAKAFLPNPDNKPNINHKDGNPKNNDVENLERCTQKENIRHSIDILGHKPKSNATGKLGKLNWNSKIVIQYTLSGNFIKEWDSTMDIQRQLGISNVSISQCCLYKISYSHGYKWRYK